MPHKAIAVLIIVLFVALSGCKTFDEYVGEGPIVLSEDANKSFQRYLIVSGIPQYFAASLDGKYGYYSYCHDTSSCGRWSHPSTAIAACEEKSKGVPCKIYAKGKDIVWRTTPGK